MADRMPALSLIPGGATTDPDPDIEPAEPTPPPVDPPPGLSDPARTVWDELAPALPAGVLTPADAPAFGLLCTSVATWREADELVQASGILINGANGELVDNPALRIRDREDAKIAKWAQKFGLTPGDRRAAAPPIPTGPRGIPHLVQQ